MSTANPIPFNPINLNACAQGYVQLGLALGLHSAGFVDAYAGPAGWQPLPGDKDAYPPEVLAEGASILTANLAASAYDGSQRADWLRGQTRALEANIAMLQGRRFGLAEQARLLYDVEPKRADEGAFRKIHEELEGLVPGTGELAERMEAHKRRRLIAADEALRLLDEIIVPELRRRSQSLWPLLPEGESATLELAKDVPWRAYNWWKGGGHSLVQFNTDVPLDISQLAAQAAHETYPGHHMHHVVAEQELVRKNGWLEHTIDLFGVPACVIMEGVAMCALPAVMDGDEWTSWHRDEVFPAAGTASLDAEREFEIERLIAGLQACIGDAAFMLMEDRAKAGDVAEWLRRYMLLPEEEAEQKVRFIRHYGAFVFNYFVGAELLWKLFDTSEEGVGYWFQRIIREPVLPSHIRAWIETGRRVPIVGG